MIYSLSEHGGGNGNSVTRNTIGNSENPCTVKAVTTVTLFYNFLRGKKRKLYRGKKSIYSIKDKREKAVTVVTEGANAVFARVFKRKKRYGACYEALRKLLPPPPLTEQPSGKAPTSEITFPPQGQKLFKGGFPNGHSIKPFQAENPRTTGSH